MRKQDIESLKPELISLAKEVFRIKQALFESKEEQDKLLFFSRTTNKDLNELFLAFAKKNNISAPWFFEQMLAKIATVYPSRIITEIGPEGARFGFVYSGREYVEQLWKDPVLFAYLSICTHPARATFLPNQTSQETRNYCALVPLIMSAHKRYNNINYNTWVDIQYITAAPLADAMLSEPLEITAEEALAERERGLVAANKRRSELTTYALYLKPSDKLYGRNALEKLIYTQCWAAHPSNRTQYMILDPKNWDNMPEPLITPLELFESNNKNDKRLDNMVLPWL